MQNELICIICFGTENLNTNGLCYNNCKFFYHKCCYIQWQKVQQNDQSTCIICKEPIINFITGEVSLINPLARFNNLEIENINFMDCIHPKLYDLKCGNGIGVRLLLKELIPSIFRAIKRRIV